MTDPNPHPEHEDGRRTPPGNTHRYGPSEPGYPPSTMPQRPYPPYGQYGAPQPGGYYGPPQKPKAARPSGAFTAALVGAALVAGAVAGVAGSAGFVAADRLTGDTIAGSTTTSTVAAQPPVQGANGSVQQVARAVLPSVVKINVRGPQGAGSGSGIILSSNGEILTNNHVVAVANGGGSMWVNLNSGRAVKATVVGTDPVTDLAVIRAQDVSGLTPATLAKPASLQVGQPVVAIGSPFGLQATVTSGIISALNRPVSVSGESATSSTTYPAIQTDAAINPGNSGGPLVNMNGEVIGINSSIRTATSGVTGQGGSIGLGFAIPIDKVLPVVDQLRNGQTPTHARLGVTVTDASGKGGMLSGAGVTAVTPGSAASQAGLKRRDVITKVGSEPVTGADSLVATIRGHRPGDTVTLTVVRGGSTKTFQVTLGSDGGKSLS